MQFPEPIDRNRSRPYTIHVTKGHNRDCELPTLEELTAYFPPLVPDERDPVFSCFQTGDDPFPTSFYPYVPERGYVENVAFPRPADSTTLWSAIFGLLSTFHYYAVCLSPRRTTEVSVAYIGRRDTFVKAQDCMVHWVGSAEEFAHLMRQDYVCEYHGFQQR